MKKAIVTDMGYRMALAPARCLARAGYCVVGVETDSQPEARVMGFASKSLASHKLLPGGDMAGGLRELSETLSQDGEKPVIVPVGRQAIEALRCGGMEKCLDFIIPGREAVAAADDKWGLYKLARSLDLPAPFTTAISEWGSLEELVQAALYPCFVKFRNGELLGLKPAERYRIAENPEQLREIYPKMEERDADPIVQQVCPGRDVGIAVVMDRDCRMVDYICYESLREYPVSGGPTCLCRTVESPKMVEYAGRLLKEIGYTGIAMLDFKGSPEEPQLLEINPRIWGSANICDVSYSSFFESYARAAAGERLPEPSAPGYQVGVTMRFSPQDAASYIGYLKCGRPFFKTTAEYVRTAFDTSIRNGVKKRGDMGPHRRYMKGLFKRVI